MFQFRRFPPYCYGFTIRSLPLPATRFPHSEIHGSKRICRSPWLIAACRVLHRLSVTRHSPCALLSLTFAIGPGSLSFRKNFESWEIFQFIVITCCVIISHRLLAFLIHIKMFRVIQFSRCKPKTDFGSKNRGGDEGDRTPYPLLARQVLSQMSYGPRYLSRWEGFQYKPGYLFFCGSFTYFAAASLRLSPTSLQSAPARWNPPARCWVGGCRLGSGLATLSPHNSRSLRNGASYPLTRPDCNWIRCHSGGIW